METIKLVIIIVSLVILVGVWSVFIFFTQQKKKTPNLTFSEWFLGKEQPTTPSIQPISTQPTISSIPTEGTQEPIQQGETKPFEFKGDEPLFSLEESKETFKIPDFPDQKQIDCKYPLIPPYTYAHIQWNNAASELVYTIEEPILTEEEKKLLEQLEEGIKELINLSFINVKDEKTVIIYLEKNIRVLLTELAIPVSKESFVKIMYYIYRDFVGLNDLEPLMNDPNIEDIECNGVKTPVYVVHRKFRNIRTSLVYPDIPKMASFVEKLAQKCGKYISYADPILDGSLPGGSRVNATYSTDISTRGPTYSIRKFTSEPWSGIQLMMKGTASAEMLAYLWMLLEYENSMMVIGGTGSGKCVTGDTPIYLANGEIVDIKSLVENKFKSNIINKQDDWEFVNGDGEEVLSMDISSNLVEGSKIERYWRHKAPPTLIRINTEYDRELSCTPEHPFFIFENDKIIKKRADNLLIGDRIAYPKNLEIGSEVLFDEIKSISHLLNHEERYVYDLTVAINHNFIAGKIPLIAHNTSLINAIAFFIPPQARVVTIEDSVTGDSKIILKLKNKILNLPIKEAYRKYKNSDAEVVTIDENNLLKFIKPSKYIKHMVNKEIYEIKTSTGRKIKVTKDHSIFTLGDGGLKEIKPTELEENKSFIAVPRSLPIEGNQVEVISLMDYLHIFDKEFLVGEPVRKIFSKYKYRDFGVNKSTYAWWKRNNILRIKRINDKIKLEFTDEELKKLKVKSRQKTTIPVMFGVDEDFITLCGLWIAEGSYDGHNKNVVIISNTDKECRNLVKRIADRYKFNYSIMTDKGTSIRLHSTVFYKFMQDIIGLGGYAHTKKVPEFIFNLSNEQLQHFVRGYFSGDGTVNESEVSCSSQSRILLEDIQTILLRFGIISRIGKKNKKDNCISLRISTNANIELFKEIGFLQKRQNKKLIKLNKKATHASSDIIPLSINKLHELNKIVKIQWSYLNGVSNIGRDFLKRIAPKGSEFNDLSHNDILWDKVKKIKKLPLKEIDVYDLSIPKYEKFICNNIIVHNTAELKLEHENWLPSVSRAGVGSAGASGQKHGEVSLFDLLKASFRQRPDYIIVGEVRGAEASVLMQSAASGHACMGTMHAESVDTMVRRLQTPPINLSGALIESLAGVAVMQPTKVKGQEVRRLTKIDEIVKVRENLGGSVTNTVFKWIPTTDTFAFNPNSNVIKKIGAKYGWTEQQVLLEMKRRSTLLRELLRRNVTNYKDVQRVINLYYKDPKTVLKAYGIKI